MANDGSHDDLNVTLLKLLQNLQNSDNAGAANFPNFGLQNIGNNLALPNFGNNFPLSNVLNNFALPHVGNNVAFPNIGNNVALPIAGNNVAFPNDVNPFGLQNFGNYFGILSAGAHQIDAGNNQEVQENANPFHPLAFTGVSNALNIRNPLIPINNNQTNQDTLMTLLQARLPFQPLQQMNQLNEFQTPAVPVNGWAKYIQSPNQLAQPNLFSMLQAGQPQMNLAQNNQNLAQNPLPIHMLNPQIPNEQRESGGAMRMRRGAHQMPRTNPKNQRIVQRKIFSDQHPIRIQWEKVLNHSFGELGKLILDYVEHFALKIKPVETASGIGHGSLRRFSTAINSENVYSMEFLNILKSLFVFCFHCSRNPENVSDHGRIENTRFDPNWIRKSGKKTKHFESLQTLDTIFDEATDGARSVEATTPEQEYMKVLTKNFEGLNVDREQQD